MCTITQSQYCYIFPFPVLCQVYTRSVIDPIPAPEGDAASKAADRQKKKGGKMTDEEIMDKLSMSKHRKLHIADRTAAILGSI